MFLQCYCIRSGGHFWLYPTFGIPEISTQNQHWFVKRSSTSWLDAVANLMEALMSTICRAIGRGKSLEHLLQTTKRRSFGKSQRWGFVSKFMLLTSMPLLSMSMTKLARPILGNAFLMDELIMSVFTWVVQIMVSLTCLGWNKHHIFFHFARSWKVGKEFYLTA